LGELRSLYPNAASKTITVNSTAPEICFKDFYEGVKNFDKYDFIYRPFVRVQQE